MRLRLKNYHPHSKPARACFLRPFCQSEYNECGHSAILAGENMERKFLIFFSVGIALILSLCSPGNSATILPADNASQIVALRNTTVKDGVISGEVVNDSPRIIRDVELLIRYIWQWKDEFRPGDDTEGNAFYYTVKGDIRPGGSMPFTYRPPAPISSRPNGDFETTVSISGYTEVIQ